MISILAATIAATTAQKRLTTLPKLKAEFLSPEAEYSDPELVALIDEASASIARFMNIRSAGVLRPTLAAETLEETFPEVRGARHSVALARLPVRAVTAVTEGETRIPRLIDDAANPDFDFEYDAGSGILRAISREMMRGRIKVEYQAGWITPADDNNRDLPFELETACLLMCQQIANRRSESRGNAVNMKSANLTGLGTLTFDRSSSAQWLAGLPSDVRSVVSAYSRPNV